MHAIPRFSIHRARRHPPGTSPGTVIVDPKAPPPRIEVVTYGPSNLREEEIEDPAAIAPLVGKEPVTWVNVTGLGDAEVMASLRDTLGLHALAMEDVVNVGQRAKVEDYGDQLFVVVRMPRGGEQQATEQLSLFLAENLVLTFQEHPGDSFEPVRRRLRRGGPRLRNGKADYLAYALLDAVVDSYFPVLDRVGEELDRFEIRLLDEERLMHELYEAKRHLQGLRSVIRPLGEAVGSLLRDPTTLITQGTRVFLRDCLDHAIQMTDLVEHYQTYASNLIELDAANENRKLNEVMKVLTIIATIFIPLSFIAGVYGMNFNPGASPFNMPELEWYLGYPFALGLMVVVALLMLFMFMRRGWLGSRGRKPPSR
jgi:magnesium transporter